jgi:hypothetical protein
MAKYNPLDPPEDACQPADVRFQEVKVEPWPGGKKIRVHVTLTPFVKRPDLSASVRDEQDNEVCSADIIQTMDDRMVFTLHLRGELPSRHFTLRINVSYEDIGQVDQRSLQFEIQPGES